jgi:hypothetical protein
MRLAATEPGVTLASHRDGKWPFPTHRAQIDAGYR